MEKQNEITLYDDIPDLIQIIEKEYSFKMNAYVKAELIEIHDEIDRLKALYDEAYDQEAKANNGKVDGEAFEKNTKYLTLGATLLYRKAEEIFNREVDKVKLKQTKK